MAFGIAPSLLFLQEKGLPPEVGSVSGLRCTGEDVGSGEGRTKLVLTGRSVVSAEPEKGSDTKRASLLKATERTCNPLHRIASSDRERSVKCSALLPGRRKAQQHTRVSSGRGHCHFSAVPTFPRLTPEPPFLPSPHLFTQSFRFTGTSHTLGERPGRGSDSGRVT